MDTAQFLSQFYIRKIVVIYSLLAISIKNLEVRQNNKKLSVIRKNVLWLKLVSQKKATGI